MEKFIEVLHQKKDREENNVIFRLTGALAALPLTLVIGTINKLKFLSISVEIPLLSDLLLNEIKPGTKARRESTAVFMSLYTFQISSSTLQGISTIYCPK